MRNPEEEGASDGVLLDRTRAGDEGVLETLFERHERVLRASLRRMIAPSLRRKVSVSDALQQTRLAAVEAWPAGCARYGVTSGRP